MANNKNRNKNKRTGFVDDYIPPYDAAILAKPIEELGLREDTLALLKSANINLVVDIAKRQEKDFYRIMTFNKKNLFDIRNRIVPLKITFKPTPAIEDNGGIEKLPDESKITPRVGANAPIKNNPPIASKNQPLANKDIASRQGSRAPENPRQPIARTANDNKPKQANKNNNFVNESEARTKEMRNKLRPAKPQVVLSTDKFIKVNKNNKWGFADRSGKDVIAPLYDEVFSFKEDICCVEKEELFGYINREGEEIIPIIYECASSFSEGLACVFKGGKCGYINANNEIIIDFKYDAGTQVEEGSCRIKRDGKWGELAIANPREIRWIN